jgi:AraC-like DNA-binding protein
MYTALIHFLFFSASLALLFSAIHLLVRTRTSANYNLSALLACLAVLLFQEALILDGSAAQRPALLTGHLTLVFAVGPLAYFAYHLVVFPASSLPARRYFYFLFALPALAADVYFALLPRDEKIALAARALGPHGLFDFNLPRFAFAVAGLVLFAGLGSLLASQLRLFRAGTRTRILVVNIVYTAVTITGSEMILCGYVLGLMPLIASGAFVIGALFVGSLLVGMRHPRLIQLMIVEARARGEGRSHLKEVDVEITAETLTRLMEEERLYRNEELSLNDLADALSVTAHQLSELLNDHLDTNFNAFVNHYRVREAMDLLLDEPSRPVLSIAYATGFNSKSAFYDAFTRFTGTSPLNYRKRHLREKKS